MRKSLYCAACGARLTTPLEILSGKDLGVQVPEYDDGKPLTPPGIGFESLEPALSTVLGDRVALDFTPQYWLNPDDLNPAVRNSDDMTRLNGCCGLDGCNGPNQLCSCGAEIGTLRTDCWTPYMFIPEPTKTTWIDAP